MLQHANDAGECPETARAAAERIDEIRRELQIRREYLAGELHRHKAFLQAAATQDCQPSKLRSHERAILEAAGGLTALMDLEVAIRRRAE